MQYMLLNKQRSALQTSLVDNNIIYIPTFMSFLQDRNDDFIEHIMN